MGYHYEGDQDYYDYFASMFANTYRITRDNSLRDEIGSDDAEYIMRRLYKERLAEFSTRTMLYETARWPDHD